MLNSKKITLVQLVGWLKDLDLTWTFFWIRIGQNSQRADSIWGNLVQLGIGNETGAGTSVEGLGIENCLTARHLSLDRNEEIIVELAENDEVIAIYGNHVKELGETIVGLGLKYSLKFSIKTFQDERPAWVQSCRVQFGARSLNVQHSGNIVGHHVRDFKS